MSENSKINNDNGLSCLHCSVYNSKQQYQEIFDEVGIEIELAQLLAKYFQIVVKPDAEKSQLLCQECVNTLIRFFDIDELQREQDAANALKNAAKQQEDLPIAIKKVEKSAKKTRSTSLKAKSVTVAAKSLQMSVKLVKPSTVATSVVTTTAPKTEPDCPAIRITKARTVAPKRLSVKAKEVVKPNAKFKVKSRGSADQEQISALIRDILDDDEAPADDKFTEAAATVRQLEKQTGKKQRQLETEETEPLEEEDNNEELEFLLEQDGKSTYTKCSERFRGLEHQQAGAVNRVFTVYIETSIFLPTTYFFLQITPPTWKCVISK